MYESPEYCVLKRYIERLQAVQVWVDRARMLRSMCFAEAVIIRSSGSVSFDPNTHEHEFVIPSSMSKKALEDLADTCVRNAQRLFAEEQKPIDLERAAKV